VSPQPGFNPRLPCPPICWWDPSQPPWGNFLRLPQWIRKGPDIDGIQKGHRSLWNRFGLAHQTKGYPLLVTFVRGPTFWPLKTSLEPPVTQPKPKGFRIRANAVSTRPVNWYLENSKSKWSFLPPFGSQAKVFPVPPPWAHPLGTPWRFYPVLTKMVPAPSSKLPRPDPSSRPDPAPSQPTTQPPWHHPFATRTHAHTTQTVCSRRPGPLSRQKQGDRQSGPSLRSNWNK